jgi:hypothetical protein
MEDTASTTGMEDMENEEATGAAISLEPGKEENEETNR